MGADILNAAVLFANFVLIPALSYGSQLALGALGVTLVYAVLRFSNFAHGDTMAFGAMLTMLATWALQAYGISLAPLPTALLALPLGVAVTAAVCVLLDKLVYRHYRRRNSPPVVFVIVSVGVMFILHGVVRFVVGPQDRQFADGARFILHAREFKEMTGLAEGLTIKTSQGLTIVAAFILVAALLYLLQKTRAGKAMRAFSDNADLALLCGVDAERVVRITWVLVAALAAVAGVLYGLDKSFKPFTYFQLLLPIFAAAIVGGIGKPMGAIAGGFTIAFAEVALTYAYKKFFAYLVPAAWAPQGLMQLLSTDYKFAVSFIILVAVLLIRPTGIFRGRLI